MRTMKALFVLATGVDQPAPEGPAGCGCDRGVLGKLMVGFRLPGLCLGTEGVSGGEELLALLWLRCLLLVLLCGSFCESGRRCAVSLATTHGHSLQRHVVR